MNGNGYILSCMLIINKSFIWHNALCDTYSILAHQLYLNIPEPCDNIDNL